VNEAWLAKQLQPYAIRPRTIWIGNQHLKGYYEKELRLLLQRYVPNCEVDALLAEDATIKAAAKLNETEQAPGDASQGNEEPGNAESGEAAAA